MSGTSATGDHGDRGREEDSETGPPLMHGRNLQRPLWQLTRLGQCSGMTPERKRVRSYPRDSVPQWSSLDEWWREVGEAELRLILWAAWDPIGRVPRDEYDWYVPRLWGLLKKHAAALRVPAEYEELTEAEQDEYHDGVNASQKRIVAQLSEWRIERMSLSANRREDEIVAEKLTDWLDPPGLGFSPSDLAD
jgi:hypothetical protein